MEKQTPNKSWYLDHSRRGHLENSPKQAIWQGPKSTDSSLGTQIHLWQRVASEKLCSHRIHCTWSQMKSSICRQMVHFREITSAIAMQEFQSNSPKKSWILVLFHTINKNCGKWNLGLHINLASSSLLALNSNYSSCWAYRSDLFHLYTPCTAKYKINFYLTKWTNSMQPIRVACNLGGTLQKSASCQHRSQAIRMLLHNEALLIGWLIGIFHLKLLTDPALVSFPRTSTNSLPCLQVLQLLNPPIGNRVKIIH